MKRPRGLKRLLGLLPPFLQYPILRKMVRVYDPPPGFIFKVADTPEEFESAMRLLYQCYRQEGFCEPNSSGLRITKYHLSPSTANLIVKNPSHEVVGTISIIVDGARGLPAEQVIDLAPMRALKLRIAEISSLAVAPGYRGRIAIPLLKFFYEYVTGVDAIDTIIATTVDEVARFYEAVLLFNRLSERPIDNYRFANNVTVIPVALDLNAAPARYQSTYSWRRTDADLYDYFVNRKIAHQFQSPAGKYFTLRQNPEVYLSLIERLTTAELLELGLSYADHTTAREVPESDRGDRYDIGLRGRITLPGRDCEIKVLNASQDGILARLGEPMPTLGSGLKLPLALKVGPKLYSQTVGEVRWINDHNLVGLKLNKTDHQWPEFIRNIRENARQDSPLNIKRAA